MDIGARDEIERTFGGKIPAGFELEYDEKQNFYHRRGITGRLRGVPLLELLWAWRDFFPETNGKPATRDIEPVEPEPVPSFPVDAEEGKQREVEEPTEVTWDTIELGRQVAVYFSPDEDSENKKLYWGTYLGPWGKDTAKIGIKGDDAKYRRLPKADVDINGRK